jgi:hypothetical protein
MGFGLHAGWAIEGAVGSLQKVDATYLSPHVNMAARYDSILYDTYLDDEVYIVEQTGNTYIYI